MSQLRKTIILEVLGEEFPIEVDFRLLETMERVFSVGAVDTLVPMFMSPEHAQRRLVADVVADTLGRQAKCKLKRSEIREFVILCDFEQEYSRIVLLLGAALTYSLRAADAEAFEKIVAGANSLKKKAAAPAKKPRAGASPTAMQ